VAVYFLDTSAVVKRYVQETGTAWIKALADQATGHFLYVDRITDVEMTAAIARRRRLGSLTIAQAGTALNNSAKTSPNITASWKSRSSCCGTRRSSPICMCCGLMTPSNWRRPSTSIG
jgi:hypothetical protein